MSAGPNDSPYGSNRRTGSPEAFRRPPKAYPFVTPPAPVPRYMPGQSLDGTGPPMPQRPGSPLSASGSVGSESLPKANAPPQAYTPGGSDSGGGTGFSGPESRQAWYGLHSGEETPPRKRGQSEPISPQERLDRQRRRALEASVSVEEISAEPHRALSMIETLQE